MAYIDNVTNILQIQPDGLPTFVRLSQNENGRNLYFQLAGNEIDIPANATITISGTKPDGTVYSGTGSISDNVILIPEMIQMTAVAGYWDAKVKIISGGNTIATGRIRFVIDADTVDPDSVPSDSELEGLVAEAQQYAETARTEAYGSPLTATTAAGMTDHTRVYVYTGSETGYTAGHWYYWDGTQWTDGGIYNSTAVNTDPTLTLAGVAADAKATGDAIEAARVAIDDTLTNEGEAADAAAVGSEISGLKEDLQQLGTPPKIVEPEETEADLYVCDPNGNVIAKFKNGHIMTKEFDSSAINTDMIMEADSSEADLYICDSFGNVVAEFANGHIVTKHFDSADYVNVLSDIDTLQEDVESLDNRTSGVLYQTKAFDDGVYAACKYKMASNHQFCMLIAGDCHTDYDSPQHYIEYLNAVDAFDCAVMLGDIVGNTFADSIEHYANALPLATKPVLTVMGNHDVRNATSDAELYSKYGSLFQYADLSASEAVNGKCYYYKDFAVQKIRVIVLMQYDYIYTGELCFGQSQIDWLIGVLNSTPTDYGVIICEHTNPSRYMAYNMDTAYTSSTWHRSNYAPTAMNGDPVPDIINAWINGTSISQSYAYTYENPPADLSVSADFTSRGAGEFISYFGGHWHQNVLGNVQNHADQMDFHTQACSSIWTTAEGDIPRKKGTMSEDSFCAVAVDRDAKTVKVFQVGAHFTYDATDRQYFKYNYGGTNA